MAEKAYFEKRTRRVQKQITMACLTGASQDTLTIVGPCTDLVISVRNTGTDAYTPNAQGVGVENYITRLTASSNIRGTLIDCGGEVLVGFSRSIFNTAAPDNTSGAEQGFEVNIPMGLDAGELCTITVSWPLVVAATPSAICVTGDMGAAGYTNPVFRATVVLGQPSTYWAIRESPLGAAGVATANVRSQQPQIPIVPNFALVGVLAIMAQTALTTVLTDATLGEMIMVQGDDYLLDDFCRNIKCFHGTRMYNAIPAGMLFARFTPVANDQSTQLVFIVNTTTIAQSQVGYLYQSGKITSGGISVAAPQYQAGISGEVSMQQPQRALPQIAPGPPLKQGGSGLQLLNLRR